MKSTDKPQHPPSRLIDTLHIYGLFGIAVAYPVFNFLRANPNYLLVNGISAEQLYIIILLTVFAVPTLIVVIEMETARWTVKLSRAIHFISLTLLVALSFCPLVSRIEMLPLWIAVIVILVLTGIVVREIRTSRFTYTALALLVPISLLLTVDFMRNHNIRQLLDFDRAEVVDWEAEANNQRAPVVMVVFDALPLIHLLDADGNIDRKRFPNFAAMSDESTWYSNATTVHDLTLKSIPAMLTGTFPRQGPVMPLPGNYSTTLFDALRYDYQIHAQEMSTDLAGVAGGNKKARTIKTKVLVTDLAIFYLRALMPTRIADQWLPLEKDAWGGFLDRMPDRSKGNWKNIRDWQNEIQTTRDIDKQVDVTTNFIKEINSYPGNTLHFLHVMLPHPPYRYLPNGTPYPFAIDEPILDEERVKFERAAHILQVGLADKILGSLRSELLRLGRWNQATVIVTSDHGQAYHPNSDQRIAKPENFGEIGFVPLLIKYSGQTQGVVDDTNAQSFDIAPTACDAVNAEFPKNTDGRSLLNKNAPIPNTKRIMSERGSSVHTFEKEDYLRARQAAHLDAIEFFSLNDPRADMFNFGPGLEYVGQAVETLAGKKRSGQVKSNLQNGTHQQTFKTGQNQLMIKGTIEGGAEFSPSETVVAIALNGQVKTVCTAFLAEDELKFHKVISDTYFEPGENIMELLILPMP